MSIFNSQKLVKNAKIEKFKCDILGKYQTMYTVDQNHQNSRITSAIFACFETSFVIFKHCASYHLMQFFDGLNHSEPKGKNRAQFSFKESRHFWTLGSL